MPVSALDMVQRLGPSGFEARSGQTVHEEVKVLMQRLQGGIQLHTDRRLLRTRQASSLCIAASLKHRHDLAAQHRLNQLASLTTIETTFDLA